MSSPVAALSDDAARSAIAELCARQEPSESAKAYSTDAWEREFEKPWTLIDERYLRTSTEIEGMAGRFIYCRTCVKPKRFGKLLAYRMYVTYEDDVMGVSKHGLIHMECHGCGFEMHHPRKPKVRVTDFESFDEAGKIDAAAYAKLAQMVGKAKYGSPVSPMQQKHEEMQRRLQELAHQGFPQEHLAKIAEAIERNERQQIDRAVAPSIKPFRHNPPY